MAECTLSGDCCAIAEARGAHLVCQGQCKYSFPYPIDSIRCLIADDAYAVSFQSTGQYRTALLREIDRLKEEGNG